MIFFVNFGLFFFLMLSFAAFFLRLFFTSFFESFLGLTRVAGFWGDKCDVGNMPKLLPSPSIDESIIEYDDWLDAGIESVFSTGRPFFMVAS